MKCKNVKRDRGFIKKGRRIFKNPPSLFDITLIIKKLLEHTLKNLAFCL